MSAAFDPWAALAKIQEGGLAGLGGLGGGHPSKRISDPSRVDHDREAVAAGSGGGAHDLAEREALAAHYAAEAGPAPYDPAAPDAYRDALLEGAKLRPPCWPMTSGPPPEGARCTMCRGGRWWCPAEPREDGLGPSAHWRCAACHPPPAGRDAREART